MENFCFTNDQISLYVCVTVRCVRGWVFVGKVSALRRSLNWPTKSQFLAHVLFCVFSVQTVLKKAMNLLIYKVLKLGTNSYNSNQKEILFLYL